MISGEDFRDLVSGRRRGLACAVTRCMLRAAGMPYAAAMRCRNWRYDSGAARVHRLPAPVISVGNLTLGGTGKTPLVEWLARWLAARGVRVAVVSRGYGARAKPGAADQAEPNDEARELAENLPGLRHFQNADRLLACRRALHEAGAEILLLDDAFQHRRVARDLDILLADACEPFGFERIFPGGTLREPLLGARRAHAIVLTRADMVGPAERASIRARFARLAPAAAWLEMRHSPTSLRSADGNQAPLEALRGQRVAALCGIGNPRGFRHSLARAGCELVACREFPDHHCYTRRELAMLAEWAGGLPVTAVVCTHKDLVKLPVSHLGSKPLWALRVSARFDEGQAALEALLAPLCRRGGPGRVAAA